MFYLDPKNKNKLNKVTTPVDFGINPINPRDYPYAIEIAGNIQDTKGCTPTIDSIQPFEIDGNNGKNIIWDMSFDTYQSDGHLESSNKPFKKYHIKRAYHSWGLHKFQGVLRCQFDPRSGMANANKPLTFDMLKVVLSSDHIQTTSLNDGIKDISPDTSLIYTNDICCNNLNKIVRKSFIMNIYSSMKGINKMHIKYAFSLKCKYVYISYLVYICVQNLSFGFDKDDSPKRGLRGFFPFVHIYTK